MGKQESLGYALLVKPSKTSSTQQKDMPVGAGAVYSAVLPTESSSKPSLHRSGGGRRKSLWARLLYIILTYLALLIIVSTTLLTCGYFFVRHQVRRFTVMEPVVLPVQNPPLSQYELQVLKDRTQLFFDEILADNGNEPDDLVITVDEINGALAASSYLRGNMMVVLQQNKVVVDMSLPTYMLPGGRDRYFVASASLQMKTLADGTTEATTALETLNEIDGVKDDGPIVQTDLHVLKDDEGEWIVNVLSGHFLDNYIPQDWIDKKENILDNIYDSDDGCQHKRHGHSHHRHDDGDHHNYHHRRRHGDHHHHDDDGHDVKKILQGIAGIDVSEGAITIRARPRRDTATTGPITSSRTTSWSYDASRPAGGGDNRQLRGGSSSGSSHRPTTTSTRTNYVSRMLWNHLLF